MFDLQIFFPSQVIYLKFLCQKYNEENLPFYHEIHDKIDYDESNHIPSEDIKLFFREMNNLNNHKTTLSDDDSDFSSLLNCKYVDVKALNLQKLNGKTFSILHLNIGYLSLHKD